MLLISFLYAFHQTDGRVCEELSVTRWLMQRTVTNSVCFDTVSVMLILCRSEGSEIPAFFTVYRYRNKLLSEEIVVSFLFAPSALASKVKCFVLP